VGQHSNAALTPRGRALLVDRVLNKAWPINRASRAAGISIPTARKWVRRFKEEGRAGLMDRSSRPHRLNTTNKPASPELQELVVALLHTPPSQHGLNRTTWRLVDLREALGKNGTTTSIRNIAAVIRQAGYRYRQARIALTSQDPDYKEKVDAITATLADLEEDEAFFSVDEFGPFAVKMRAGKSLQAGSVRTVPQWQRSRGALILTAALELRSNQLTFFFSTKKNTEETLALVEQIRKGYRDRRRIYLSWDAAPWHDSKALHQHIQFLNDWAAYDCAPLIELRPLPSSSQFLNVIESVFSGMARAVIHCSDYKSVEEAQAAISKYIDARNEAFLRNPRRAGDAIWGKERTPSRFALSNACKDPRYR
jgi:transposase